MIPGLETLFVIVVISALTPIVTRLVPGNRLPGVVVLLVAGMVIGPSVLDLGDPEDVTLLSNLGLGFLFLLAGYEVKLEWFGQRSGRLAMGSWAVSAVLALSVTAVLTATGLVRDYLAVALALTTTALGTLLPILRDADMLRGRFRELMLASGAVGELFPIIAIAILLGANGSVVGLVSIVLLGLIGYGIARLVPVVRGTRLERIVLGSTDSTTQSTLRFAIALLVGLLVIAQDFGVDSVLGAFIAGMVLRRWGPEDANAIDAKLDAVGYGFFIPIFFVASGMAIDVPGMLSEPLRLLAFFVLMLLVRGVPSYLIYRRDLGRRSRVELMLLNATALPLVIALVQIGIESGVMLPENGAALVGAGVLSVLVYPLIATTLHRRHPDLDGDFAGPSTGLLGDDVREASEPSADR